jgi:hypothetical protein
MRRGERGRGVERRRPHHRHPLRARSDRTASGRSAAVPDRRARDPHGPLPRRQPLHEGRCRDRTVGCPRSHARAAGDGATRRTVPRGGARQARSKWGRRRARTQLRDGHRARLPRLQGEGRARSGNRLGSCRARPQARGHGGTPRRRRERRLVPSRRRARDPRDGCIRARLRRAAGRRDGSRGNAPAARAGTAGGRRRGRVYRGRRDADCRRGRCRRRQRLRRQEQRARAGGAYGRARVSEGARRRHRLEWRDGGRRGRTQLHVACACERLGPIPCGIIGHHFYEDDPTLERPLDIDGRRARLVPGPGLGVELSAAVVRRFSS